MKVLITGASGFVGRHLTKLLAAEGSDVFLLDRNLPAFSAFHELKQPKRSGDWKIVAADLTDRDQTYRALADSKPDAVVHLASSGVGDPNLSVDQALNDNVNGTLNLARACFERVGDHSPDRLIIARTPGELTAMNVYAASKAAAWSFCSMFARTKAYPIVGAMIFQAYGPFQAKNAVIPAAFQAALDNVDFPMTSGLQEKDWIYIDDVAAGIRSILSTDLNPGTTIELGTGKATPLRQVVTQIYELVGGDGKPLPGFLEDRIGEARKQVAAPDISREHTGWNSKVLLAEGLRRYYHWARGTLN